MDSTRKRKCTLPPPVTISNFDDSDQSSSSSETFETKRLLRRIPSEMCLVSLLEELCACYAKDSREQRILFKNLSGYLSKAKMIPVTTTQDEFLQVRTKYRIAIRNFLYTALAASQADPEERYLSMPATGVSEQIKKAFLEKRVPVFFPSFLNPNFQKQSPQLASRYKKDFVELKRIGKGGFGSVYKVRSILDNQEYAIKKIKLKGTDKEFYEKVIREVTLLARMQHPNIVRYNTAWIDHQPSQTTPRKQLPAIEFNQQESSSSDDIENELCSKPISSEYVPANCIIKEITDEIIEGDIEFNCDPTVEEIDESDVEFKFESDTYESKDINSVYHKASFIHSNTKISSRQSTTVLNSESFQLTSDEQMETYEFSNVTTSAVTTEELFSSKEKEHIHLRGTFGSYKGLRCNNESYSDHIESLDLTDGAGNGNFTFRKTDDFHSLSSTACLGTRKGDQERMHENPDNPSEFENSKVILYIQMELCSRTLCDWLEERNDRDPATGCDVFSIVDESVNQAVFKQMAEGISYIHAKNFLHRDLKPKNIFLAGPEKALHICIGDFGLAREHGPEEQRGAMTPTATLDRQLRKVVMIPDDDDDKLTTEIGTSTYASPEQLYGTMYDHKSDMYSLGIICFELYHPFKSQMERSKCITALRKGNVADEIQTRWPHEFTVIEQLTFKEPHRRPSAEELKEKLSMSKDEVIKSLKKDLIERNQQLKEKDDVIESLRLELSRLRSFQQS